MREVLTAILKISVIIAAIAAMPFLYALLRILCKRLKLRSKLVSACKANGFDLVPTHAMWMFGKNSGTNFDFFIVGRRTVCAVKLFTTRSYHMELHFTDDGKYYTRKYLSFNAWDTKRRQLFSLCRDSLRPEWRMKEIVPVLLINPICREIDYVTKNIKKPLGAGDVVNNMRIYTISRLLDKLEAI